MSRRGPAATRKAATRDLLGADDVPVVRAVLFERAGPDVEVFEIAERCTLARRTLAFHPIG
jgi:hypothetical protein